MRDGKLAVLYVTPAYPVLSETFVRREIEGLRARGDTDVVVAALRVAPDGATGADEVVYGRGLWSGVISEFLSRPVRSARTLARAAVDAIAPGEKARVKERAKWVGQAIAGISLAARVRGRAEHVHAHFAHSPTSVAMYTAMQLGVGFSFAGHANDIFQRRSLLRRKLERCTFVSCISRWHREFYAGIAGLPSERMPVIRCGVEVTPRGGQVRAGGVRILTVARLVDKKGIDVLLRAVAELDGKDVSVTVAGDGPERARLGALASELGIAGRTAFLGAVENARVRDLLATSDLFVLPCREDSSGDRDGIPVVLMEAMATGVPVISGDLPAIRELILDGVTGFLVKPGDIRALSDALTRATDDPTRLQAIAAAAAKHVESEFEIGENVRRIRRAFVEQAVLYGGAWKSTFSSRRAATRPSSAVGRSTP